MSETLVVGSTTWEQRTDDKGIIYMVPLTLDSTLQTANWWRVSTNEDGKLFYFNKDANLTKWKLPDLQAESSPRENNCHDEATSSSVWAGTTQYLRFIGPKNTPMLFADGHKDDPAFTWSEYKDPTGKPYYHNKLTKAQVWNLPDLQVTPIVANGVTPTRQGADEHSSFFNGDDTTPNKLILSTKTSVSSSQLSPDSITISSSSAVFSHSGDGANNSLSPQQQAVSHPEKTDDDSPRKIDLPSSSISLPQTAVKSTISSEGIELSAVPVENNEQASFTLPSTATTTTATTTGRFGASRLPSLRGHYERLGLGADYSPEAANERWRQQFAELRGMTRQLEECLNRASSYLAKAEAIIGSK